MSTFHNSIKSTFPRLEIHDNATIQLLLSSILVAFSGALRIHIASLLLQVHSSVLTCIAGGLIIYSVYTLDRALDSEEDSINKTELPGSRKEIGLAVTGITFLIGASIFAKEGLLLFAFVPFITGYLYSKGIKIGKLTLRLKGGLGVKNLIVGITWGLCTAGVAGYFCTNVLSVAIVVLLYGVKTFINSAIDDFKDIKGDSKAGIRTLPVCLRVEKTRELLLGVHIISHLILGIAIITGLLAFEPLILGGSFICGIICIIDYTKGEKPQYIKRTVFKDGESALIIGVKMIAPMIS